MCSLEQQIRLEEYRELGLSWRADDERLSKLTRTLLPLSFLALSAPALDGTDETLYFLLIVGGAVLMIYWFLTAHIAVQKVKLRTKRMRIIEEELGMDAHSSYKKGRKGKLKDATVRTAILFVYLASAGLVILLVQCN